MAMFTRLQNSKE
uniref:Uncharacterized protein n=1 Tax=Anguilla anguilla TaxID=7936 RepID=A0A0E9R9K4_ANGAN